MVRGGGEPVEVGKHLLDLEHDGLEAFGDVIHSEIAGARGEVMRDLLDDDIAWIADGVDRVAEADDDLFALDAFADVGLGFVRRGVALLDLESHFIGAAVLGAFESTNRASYCRVHVGASAGDDTRGEGRGVELVLGVEDERDVHRLDPLG